MQRTILFVLSAAPVVVGSATAAEPGVHGPAVLALAESWAIDHPTHHVQGLCVSDEYFWVSSVDRPGKRGFVYRFDRSTLKVAAQREIAEGARFHPGGMQIHGEELWVPLAEYRPRSSTTVLCLDATTLETRRSFEVNDHLGALAIDEMGNLYGANWDSRQLYVFDHGGQEKSRFDGPTGVAYQDMKWHDGHLWAAGTLRDGTKRTAVVDVIDLNHRKLVRRFGFEGTPRTAGASYCREGFALWKNAIFLMPEDGPHSRIYRFLLP